MRSRNLAVFTSDEEDSDHAISNKRQRVVARDVSPGESDVDSVMSGPSKRFSKSTAKLSSPESSTPSLNGDKTTSREVSGEVEALRTPQEGEPLVHGVEVSSGFFVRGNIQR